MFVKLVTYLDQRNIFQPSVKTETFLIAMCHNSGQFPLIVIFTTGKEFNQFQGHTFPWAIVRC